jgi:hypothetical protein
LGFDHATVGAKLAERWRLPAEMIQAIRQHHADAPSADAPLARAVALGFWAACTLSQQDSSGPLETFTRKPIVQFDLREGRVSAGEASLYAKPNDARDFASKILELLDDPEARERMGRLGRERVEGSLAWPHEAPKLLDAYRALDG